jgi:galactose mutarotase-like enzyme
VSDPRPALTSIRSEHLSADIDRLGAQLVALRDSAGRDLQWSGDPTVWKGKAPILFPIVGAVADNRYRVDGASYALTRHGFARDRLFSLVEATASSALLRLGWDEQSLAIYPFRFELDIRFSLEGSTLAVQASVKNLEADASLPASFGFHPALRWPLPYGEKRAEHVITFEVEEPAPIRRLNAQGLVRPETFATPVDGKTLRLRDDLFQADAIIFDRLTSRSLRYGAATGPQIEIQFPDTPYLGIWGKPGADFICIEPWHGIADPQNFAGDFRAKPGVFLVPPGQTRNCLMSISLTD